MNFNKLMIILIGILALSCINTNSQKSKSNTNTEKGNENLWSSSYESITDVNFWKFNNKLNELMDGDDLEERYNLAMKIDSSNISQENRNSFNFNFFFILMDNKEYDRAIIILRDRYVKNPIPELSMNENLYIYYFWGTVIKLETTECDSADFYFKQLKEVSNGVAVISNHNIDDEMENLEKILYESCLHLN